MQNQDNATLPGGFSQHVFLADYWQQKPLLIRQAFPGIQPPCTPQELAGLCCDTDAPARLVIEQGQTPWQLISSPLQESDFLQLPDTHWSLLVNDFEQYYPQLLDEIIAPFRFIPDWRIDDLMISYAPAGGSVGPHVDEYDVFLIQVAGERHWMLDPNANADHLLPGTDLKILADFTPRQQWTLQAGDLLYLPPNLAHYGIARGADEHDNPYGCMTYSVGFRAPNQQELLGAWLEELLEHDQGLQRFSDRQRQAQQHAGEISPADLQGLHQLLLAGAEQPESMIRWLGCYLTRPKGTPANTGLLQEYLEEKYPAGNGRYFRSPASRIAWHFNKQKQSLLLFTNGEVSRWPPAVKPGVEYLCSRYDYPAEDIQPFLQQHHFAQLCQYLAAQGFLQPS